jgi:hypothetical protein
MVWITLEMLTYFLWIFTHFVVGVHNTKQKKNKEKREKSEKQKQMANNDEESPGKRNQK